MYEYENELYHYGVKGMKWGVRRYQNADGTLTDKGKKRVSEEYKKHSVKTTNDLDRNYWKRYANAYNKAANDMNNGMIDKYNADYDKKLGSKAKDHDYLNDSEYNSGYEKMFYKQVTKHYNEATVKEMTSNKNYKKAQALIDKYDMTKWDDLAKSNSEAVQHFRDALKEK